MKMTGNTILVTGGASGIGLALVKRFLERGNEVIICGRREDRLAGIKEVFPEIHTRVCDVGEADRRAELAYWVVSEFPALNVLVNNAGIQRRIDLTAFEDWNETRSEIAINLEAPIHLAQLIYPHLATQQDAAILNVTSGLSFSPLANVPVYCATKAALHSFTLSLRWQLRETQIDVIEIIPPAVDTDLQAPGLHTFGVNVDEFADHVFKHLEVGDPEIAYGTALVASQASRESIDAIYDKMNRSFR
jgi:uncharacterized oxidoreductase